MAPIDVVISGIGGRFPNSRNIKEFSENLLKGKSLLKPIDRWSPGMMGTPEFAGLTFDIDRFDHTFFGMHCEVSKLHDIQTRIALETAFEAVIDAGLNPSTIRGSKAQVYSGTLLTEGDIFLTELDDSKRSGYIIMGQLRTMSANRISYFFNLCGRSSAYEASGGWLGTGLALARDAIQGGECDTVFVNAASVMTMPEVSKQRQNMGLLSPDNTCRPFDVDANGSPRGEAQVTFLVQRADIAKRSYGSIVFAGAEPQSTLPNWFLSLNEDHFRSFLTSSYRDNGIDPNKVKLLEADGLAVKDMIEVEMNVLDEVLNEKRPKNSPLYVGTVKSMTGDTEGAAGHTALTKLILAMETGIISPTLHCRNFNPNLRGLSERRLEVVTEPTKWDVTPDTHVAVSSLSVSGVVSHVVLRANGKTKDEDVKKNHSYPYLVVMSGRTQDYVNDSLQVVASSPFDLEYIRLTQEVFATTIDKFEIRGYGFHGQNESEKFVVQRYNRRPVWFVYSGMGSQWPEMGKELMLIPTIRETFERLHKILEPKGVNLLEILTTPDPKIFDSILHAFVGIAAVQIALTNVMRELGIVPEGILGHSVGELGCSYADECLTEEQTIMASYERGMASLKAELIPGLMAAIGLGYKEAKDLLPPDVYVACRNSKDSCTISGPTESVKKVIASFEKKGIFVRGVNVSNIAYHSPYIRPAAPLLYESLRKVIPSPKLRSSKWICTSAPEEKWDSKEVCYCSAEYHTNNLLGQVYFEEGSAYIPHNALVIEIAPDGLLQAILRRSLGNSVANVPLTTRSAASPLKFLLKAIGKLFLEGQSPKIWNLYPNVEMPVSRNTPSLAPLIKWEHSEKFLLRDIDHIDNGQFFSCDLNSSCPNIEIARIKCLPAAHALVLAYHRFTEIIGAQFNRLQVIFEDVRFYDLIKFKETEMAKVSVEILPKTGIFRIIKDGKPIIEGKMRAVDKNGFESKKLPSVEGQIECCLNPDDVYSELETRGVVVPDKLKTIQNLEIRQHDWIASVSFDNDWASIINSLIILCQLGSDNVDQKPASVFHIRQLHIDPAQKTVFGTNARLHLPSGTLVYPGITISGVEFRAVNTTTGTKPVALRFVPFGQSGLEDETHFLSSLLQLTAEKQRHAKSRVKICDIDGESISITDKLHDILDSNFDITSTPKEADLLVCGPSSVPVVASTLASSNSLLLTRCGRSHRNKLEDILKETGLHIMAESDAKGPTSPLLAITSLIPPIHLSDCQIIMMKPHDPIPARLENSKHSFIIFVWENDTFQPIEKMLSDVKSTGCAEKVRLVFLMTPNAPPFSLSLPLYADQMRLNVPLNIYLDGKWGNYRLLEIPEFGQLGQNKQENLVIQPGIALENRDNNIGKLDKASIAIYDLPGYIKRPQSSKEAIVYCAKYAAPTSTAGVATWDDKSSSFVPDPALFWTVTEEWCSEKTAPALFSYAMAYYILFYLARLKKRQSLLITCPMTSLGQALIRIANSLDCDIVILVPSRKEEEQCRYLFPSLNAKAMVSSLDSLSFTLKYRHPEGVHVIVSDLTGSKLRVSTARLHKFGTIVQVGEDAMLTPDYIGMNFFLRFAVVYGVTQRTLLNASPEVKRLVQQWVAESLESGVSVPQIKNSGLSMNGSVINGLKTPYDNCICEKINGCHETEGESIDMQLKSPIKRRNSAVIIGGSKAQWVRLSYFLAKKGYKIVTLIQENPLPNLVTRHSKILHREFDMELRHLTNVRSGADLVKSDLGTLKSIFVFGSNTFAEEMVRQLDANGMKDVRLFFFSKNSAHFSRMCERWARNGLKVRAALGVDETPPCEATLDWLLSRGASTVSVLNKQAFVDITVDGMSLKEAGILPTSASELQALGSAIRKQTSPIFREVATRGRNVRGNGEVKPLFFIKGLHGKATSELETLAAGLLAPMVEITLHADCGSLEATAGALIQGIQKIQNKGPYNLAGDTIRSDVVIKVARMLEEKGYASVLFLMNEQIGSIRNGLIASNKLNKLGDLLLKAALSDSIEPNVWKNIYLDNLPWRKQVQTAVSKILPLSAEHRDDVVAALYHIYDSVQHILESQDEAVFDHDIVRFLRSGDEYRDIKLTDRCFQHFIPSTKLKRKEIADIFSQHLATPILQLEFDRMKK